MLSYRTHICLLDMTPWFIVSPVERTTMENRHKVTKKSFEMPANENKSKYFTTQRCFVSFRFFRSSFFDESVPFELNTIYWYIFSGFNFRFFSSSRRKKNFHDRETRMNWKKNNVAFWMTLYARASGILVLMRQSRKWNGGQSRERNWTLRGSIFWRQFVFERTRRNCNITHAKIYRANTL